MKLHFTGHDCRYVIEQGLLSLFPEERPTYGTIDPETDRRWAEVRLQGDEAHCLAETRLGWDGKTVTETVEAALSGTDYEREGQRRRALGRSFFEAYRSLTGVTPPWGSLTGVRPGKLAAERLRQGESLADAQRFLEESYFVSPRRARLAAEAAEAGLKEERSLGPRDIDLYLGIPFCPTRCAYCSFVSASVEKSFALIEPYLAALTEEIRAGRKAAPGLRAQRPRLLHGRRHPHHPVGPADGPPPGRAPGRLRPLPLPGVSPWRPGGPTP